MVREACSGSHRVLEVNCSTSCENPEKGGLETSMSKIMLEQHPQGKWKQFLVSNISNDMTILCHFTCEKEQYSTDLNITVYRECPCMAFHSQGGAHVYYTVPKLFSDRSWVFSSWLSSPWAPEPQAGQACGLRICLYPWVDSMSPPPILQKQTVQVLNLAPRSAWPRFAQI